MGLLEISPTPSPSTAFVLDFISCHIYTHGRLHRKTRGAKGKGIAFKRWEQDVINASKEEPREPGSEEIDGWYQSCQLNTEVVSGTVRLRERSGTVKLKESWRAA